MPRLLVNNGYQVAMGGLGRIKPLSSLSRKRVTVAVRDILRDKYGPKKVTVSCEAEWHSGRWIGTCRIASKQLSYEVW